MENIHLLPTEKPSRLFYNKKDSIFTIDNDFENVIEEDWFQDYNIYITSNEEIKEDDWVFDIFKNACPVIRQLKTEEEVLGVQEIEFKIILTTDPELIADGVQAIDDNFLEWFVKNPSCENVEVEHFGTCCGNQSITQCINCKKYNPVYKIIIPQEESKQDPTLENAKLALREYILANKEKVTEDLQEMREKSGTGRDETLEEAAKRTYQKGLQDDIDLSFYDGVRLGANYQAERMYSEVFEWLSSKDYLSDKMEFIQKEFEQFKKK
jgi:hypothetical protein